MEIIGIVKDRRQQLDAQVLGEPEQRHQVAGIFVGNGDGDSQVFYAEFLQTLQCFQRLPVDSLYAPDPVVHFGHAVKLQANPDILVPAHYIQSPLRQEAVAAYDHPFGLFFHDIEYFAEVFFYERLAAGNVQPDDLGKRFKLFRPDLLRRVARVFSGIAHGALRIASVGYGQDTIHFFVVLLFLKWQP